MQQTFPKDQTLAHTEDRLGSFIAKHKHILWLGTWIYGGSLPTWSITGHVQNRSPLKPGALPMFSSSIKGILVTLGPPRAVLGKWWPYWWDPQGRDCLLEESHLGQKWPASDTSHCAHSLARSSQNVWPCVNTAEANYILCRRLSWREIFVSTWLPQLFIHSVMQLSYVWYLLLWESIHHRVCVSDHFTI